MCWFWFIHFKGIIWLAFFSLSFGLVSLTVALWCHMVSWKLVISWVNGLLPGGCLNIKMSSSSYQYRDPHVKYKTVLWPSDLQHGNPHTWERWSLYWAGALVTTFSVVIWANDNLLSLGSWIFRIKLHRNFHRNSNILIQENHLQNVGHFVRVSMC